MVLVVVTSVGDVREYIQPLIVSCVGNTTTTSMSSRLCYHLATDRLHTKQQIQSIEATLPAVSQIYELSELFRAQLFKKCERLRKKGNRLLIVVIDALTQLDSFEYDAGGHDALPHDLEWLIPEEQMPSNLRIVLASLEGTPVEVLPPLPFSHFMFTDITYTHLPIVQLTVHTVLYERSLDIHVSSLLYLR